MHIAPSAIKAMLGEFVAELEERDETELQTDEEWARELAAFIEERAEA